MKNYALLFCGFALAMLPSTPVLADTLFNFSFTGNSSVTGTPAIPFSGAGVFDAQATGTANQFLIVGVTGTTDGQTIANVLDPGSYGFNDNLLTFAAGSASAALDNSGVSYKLADGELVNIFFGVPGQYQQTVFGFANGFKVEAQQADVSITPQASAVPEPGTLALLGTGVVGLAGIVRRRFAV